MDKRNRLVTGQVIKMTKEEKQKFFDETLREFADLNNEIFNMNLRANSEVGIVTSNYQEDWYYLFHKKCSEAYKACKLEEPKRTRLEELRTQLSIITVELCYDVVGVHPEGFGRECKADE